MSQTFDEISAQLKKRHRRSARLKWISMGALGLAGLFLLWFFSDMLGKGLPAFQQAQIQVEIDYNEDAQRMGRAALDRDVSRLVSRTFERMIPVQMRENPELLGTTRPAGCWPTARSTSTSRGIAIS